MVENLSEEKSVYDERWARETTDQSMWLPDGRHCRDCIHFAGCVRLFGCLAESVTCDWSPSRFYSRDPLTPGAKT